MHSEFHLSLNNMDIAEDNNVHGNTNERSIQQIKEVCIVTDALLKVVICAVVHVLLLITGCSECVVGFCFITNRGLTFILADVI